VRCRHFAAAGTVLCSGRWQGVLENHLIGNCRLLLVLLLVLVEPTQAAVTVQALLPVVQIQPPVTLVLVLARTAVLGIVLVDGSSERKHGILRGMRKA